MFQEYPIDAGGLRLNVATGPANGIPLVLFHGVGRRWQDMLPLAGSLAGRWHLHMVDHRGHGHSDRGSSYRVIDHVDDGIAVVRTLHQPAIIYGHSLGALTAVGIAAARPDLVQAVVLEDPPSARFLQHLANTGYHATFVAMRELAGRAEDVPTLARRLGTTLVPTPNGVTPLHQLREATALRFMARCLRDLDGSALTPAIEGRWLDGYDEQALWSAMRCPTLLLRGDPAYGGMLPTEDANTMMQRLADGTRIDCTGVGHLLHTQATDMVLRHLLNFLESL